MQKYLNIYLTGSSASMLVSATNVTAVNMASVGTVKIWYHDGGSATLTLSDNMAANDISASNYFANQIARALQTGWTNVVHETVTETSQAIPSAADAAGAAVTITSIAIA
jgi:hypothetical protein